ncbi:hypothetical protein KHQ81_14075 [Mycoplasmatota bacterium]|nr:hypothetical protein KHQ81_14075 [Mycoplasmatota bacterium]
MNKKFVILVLLILSIIIVCPLPFDNGTFLVGVLNNQGHINQLDYLFRLIGMTSGFNIICYVLILVGMIFYFKCYSCSSDFVFTSFIVIYVILLITQAKGFEFLMRFSSSNNLSEHVISVETMTKILLIITLLLMTILTILFIKLVMDSYSRDYQTPVIIFTILVYITQSILFIGSHVYTTKIANLNISNRYTSKPSPIFQNFLNFSDVMSIISLLVITTMKILFILVVIKEGIFIKEEHNTNIE